MASKVREVIIIGSGPAGMTAAIYLSRANLKPLMFAGGKWGGQLMLTTDVENYPGFVDGIQGPELMQKFREQAERFGAEIINEDVSKVDFKVSPFKVVAAGKEYQSKAVVVANGAETKWLGLANEQRLIGRGVSSCAPCDAFFFKDKKVIVVGGGDSAMEEALTLTKFASAVTIIHRRSEFRASKIMLKRAQDNKKISFILDTQVADVLGKDKVEGVTLAAKSGKKEELEIDGMFLAIGHLPLTNIYKGQLELDEKGYIVRKSMQPLESASGNGAHSHFRMLTSVDGVFVAGDVHDYHYKQAVTAAGYGCQAALEAERWIEMGEIK